MTRQKLNAQPGPSSPGINVITDYSYDEQGRPSQTLEPSHTAVVGGSAVTVRAATWYVYAQTPKPVSGTWGFDENRTGQGFTASSGNTLVDPVSITRMDKNGNTVDQITSKRTTGSGRLLPTDTFAQTDWKSWSSTHYDKQGRTISTRVYHDIPSSGEGGGGHQLRADGVWLRPTGAAESGEGARGHDHANDLGSAATGGLHLGGLQ
jgi:hypothetical protein